MSGYLGAGQAAGSVLGSVLSFVGQQQANAASAAAQTRNVDAAQSRQQDQFGANAELMHDAQRFDLQTAQDAYNRNRQLQADAQNFNAQQAGLQRDWAGGMAERTMDFQWRSQAEAERYNSAMANTAYQRANADMRAAGLNPMLAYSQGGAASPSVGVLSGSTPSGASATSPGGSSPMATSPGASVGIPGGAGIPHIGSSLGAAVAGASQLSNVIGGMSSLEADLDLKRAAVAKTRSESANLDMDTLLKDKMTTSEGGRRDQIDAQTAVLRGGLGVQSSEIGRNVAAAGASSAEALYTQAREYLTRLEVEKAKGAGFGWMSDAIDALRRFIASGPSGAQGGQDLIRGATGDVGSLSDLARSGVARMWNYLK